MERWSFETQHSASINGCNQTRGSDAQCAIEQTCRERNHYHCQPAVRGSGLSLVSGWLLVRTVEHLRQPSSQVPENSGDGWCRQECPPKWLFCWQRISQFQNRYAAEFTVVVGRLTVVDSSVKLGRGCVNSPDFSNKTSGKSTRLHGSLRWRSL